MILLAKVKGQTLMFGAIVLMISNIAVKLIGAFLRIPLTNIIGVEGMAYYNAAYSIYVTFYTISTAGIPVAVSRMIATANSSGNHKEIKRIFNVAFSLFFVIGVVGTAVMMIFSRQFALSAKMPDSYLAMLAIAPTIFFICLSSAYRGYFQGLQNMTPTAVSQVIEAFAKFGIGILAAVYFTRNNYPMYQVAAFVVLGVTIGVFLGVIYGAVIKAMFTSSAEYKNNLQGCTCDCRTSEAILKELIVIAIPITLASSIMGLTNMVDTMLFPSGLQAVGLSEKAATSFYGTYTSMVYPLFNLIPPFIYTFAISAIPAISSAIVKNDREKASKDIESAFRNCAVISIPSAIGLASLSRRVISFLFEDESISLGSSDVGAVELASPALSVISVGILFLGVISITNAVLQACKAERFTIISTSCGIVVKIIGTYFLSRVSGLGLLGAAFSTVLCYFAIMCLNLYFMYTKTGFTIRASKVFLKPLFAGILCGASAIGVSYLVNNSVLDGRIGTLLAIGVAVVVYAAVLIALKGLNRYDVMMMPKGERICSVLDKFNLLDKGE